MYLGEYLGASLGRFYCRIAAFARARRFPGSGLEHIARFVPLLTALEFLVSTVEHYEWRVVRTGKKERRRGQEVEEREALAVRIV